MAQHEQSLAADGEHIRAEAHAAAAAERTSLLDHATQEAADLQAAALAGLERDRTRMRQGLQHEAGTLALTIASRLVARIPTPALNAALLQSLDAWLATLPPDRLGYRRPTRRNAGSRHQAAPLDPQGQQACQAILNQRFNRPPSIRFATDPALIAGVELRGPHGTLRNNWRADLDRIAQELAARMTITARWLEHDPWLEHAIDRVAAAPLGPAIEEHGRVETIGDGIAMVSGLTLGPP